jgi:mannose-6-phosphate isomerase-like protein (cupin superfamily)
MPKGAKPKAKVMRIEEAFWEQPPAHFDAFSKMLVHPTNAATRYFDFRLSSYQPKGYAEVHVHEVAENIYYILQGRGIVELDGEKHLVEPHMVIHIRVRCGSSIPAEIRSSSSWLAAERHALR